jgi:hypothetical protein
MAVYALAGLIYCLFREICQRAQLTKTGLKTILHFIHIVTGYVDMVND